jgi:hypothetical protein
MGNPTWKDDLPMVLEKASFYGRPFIVDALLKIGEFKWLHLLIAIQSAWKQGHFDLVEKLLQKALNDDIGTRVDRFRAAASYGSAKRLNQFISQLNLPQTALRKELNMGYLEASLHGNLEALEVFLNHSLVNPRFENQASLYLAMSEGKKEAFIRLLRDHRIDPRLANQAIFNVAAEKGKLEYIDLLIRDQRIDPAFNENSALIDACANNHLDVVMRLIKDPRVNPAQPDYLPLKSAVWNNHVEIARYFMRKLKIFSFGALLLARTPEMKSLMNKEFRRSLWRYVNERETLF